MSRASKYLRKKLAEGGQIPDLGAELGKLKNLPELDPNIPQNTGIAGGLLAQQRLEEDKAKQAEPTQNKAMSAQEALSAFKAQNPEAVPTSMPQQTKVLPKSGAQQQQQLQQRRTSDPKNLRAQNTPEKLMERMGATKEQYEELMNVQQDAHRIMQGEEYQNLLKANQEAQGKDPQVMSRLMEIQKGLKAKQDAITSQFNPPEAQPQSINLTATPAQQSSTAPRMAAAAQSSAPSISDYDNADDYYDDFTQHYIETTGDYMLENLPTNVKQQWEDGQTTDTTGVTSTASGDSPSSEKEEEEDADTTGVTSTGSVTAPEKFTSNIPVVSDPGPKPTYEGQERGGAYENHLIALQNWNNDNSKYQKYLADVEAEKNMAKTDDNSLPDTRDGDPDLQDSGGVKTTGGGVSTSSSSSSDAPTDIKIESPTYVAPEVEVASVSADEKINRSDFPAGDAGTKQFQTARAKETQKLVAQGTEPPRRKQFPDGEAGDIQYRAAIQRFRETPIFAEGTVTEASDVQQLDESTEIERAKDSKVTADEITAAQAGEPTDVEAPEDSTAASMTASTVGQKLPTKPLSNEFGADEKGRAKFRAAREAFNAEIEKLRGEERPKFQDFDGNREAYEQALKDFQEAPLPVTEEVKAAQGEVSEKATAAVDDAELTQKAEAVKRDTAAEEAAMAEDEIVFDVNKDSYVNKVTGKVATVEETKEAEAKERAAIIGEPATGEAAEIMSMYDYNQSQKRAIQGADAKKAAVKKLKAAGLTDEAIAQRLADEPNLIADEMEDLPEDVRTTLSGLPKEALIDVQMESLMSGMEDGEVPAWARPALAKVEANLAKRGMSASSVGRDALFNAIIQSAIPMAQANASAIQGATAQDKQIAADFLAKNAGFQQQMNLANLSNDQQMRLANLSAQNQAASENLSNAQQTELANLNARLQTNLLQGKIAADMGVAQLNADQQRAVVNAQTNAGMDMAKFNAEQQVELANSKFMQTMVSTKFNADQQAAMQNATAMASMDMANLDKNTKLAVTNAQSFLQMDMANLSNEQQATILTAQQRQQALLSNQSAENAAAQFNAANQQQADQFMQNLSVQVEQYNSSANSAREQFNATEKNRIAALNAGNELQAKQFEAQLDVDIAKFNEQQDFQRDQWNAANAQAVEQSNVQWRRQTNLADTAAQNAANQQNAQISYNLTSQELTQVWQQLRDEAAYIRQSFENEEQRKAQLLATAIGNESLSEKAGKGTSAEQSSWIRNISDAI